MDPETTQALERLRHLLESGSLPEAEYHLLVAALQAKATISTTDKSAAAVGTDNDAVAERGVNVEGDDQGSIFTCDNNSLNLIIHQYSQGQKAPVTRPPCANKSPAT